MRGLEGPVEVLDEVPERVDGVVGAVLLWDEAVWAPLREVVGGEALDEGFAAGVDKEARALAGCGAEASADEGEPLEGGESSVADGETRAPEGVGGAEGGLLVALASRGVDADPRGR